MSAHTSGPWVWSGYSLRPEYPDPTRSSVHTILAAESMGSGFIGSDPVATRAELAACHATIARAPMLLAMLQRLVDRRLTFFDGMAQMSRADVLAAREEIRLATLPLPADS